MPNSVKSKAQYDAESYYLARVGAAATLGADPLLLAPQVATFLATRRTAQYLGCSVKDLKRASARYEKVFVEHLQTIDLARRRALTAQGRVTP